MRCRCVSKPFKRYAFKKADILIDFAYQQALDKYMSKFIKKHKKEGKDIVGLKEYSSSLIHALVQEKGLAHGKVREYWLRRGPRLFFVTITAVCANLFLSECFKEHPENDRVFHAVYGCFLLALSLYMLYYRLPDALLSSMMRIGHDHYGQWKRERDDLESK